MLVEKVQIPVTIEIPSDWKEQITAVAAAYGLDVSGVSRAPSGAAITFAASPSIGSDVERFGDAVKEASDEIGSFLNPPPPPAAPYRAQLASVRARVDLGEQPEITGRQLLAWFGAARRGWRVVEWIRGELERNGLITEPDFNEVWIDVPIRLKARPTETPTTRATVAGQPGAQESIDPVYRIGRLAAANQPVASVPMGTPLSEALTVMMLREFSQLPVLRSERDCKGAVSWQSVGKMIALGRPHVTVDECLQPVFEFPVEANLFDVLPTIVREGFVLVKSRDRRIQGIVTVADLSVQFRDWTEPFLLLGQIENQLRDLVRRSFTLEQLRAAKNPSDESREITDADDLTFGEYVRLLEPAAAWPNLRVAFHRDPFLKTLRATHGIRNDVMHFNPDPLGEADLTLLRNFASFLEQATRTQASA